jgi:hypothetical protein
MELRSARLNVGPTSDVERSQLRRQIFPRLLIVPQDELESIASRANKSASPLCLHPVMFALT